jgi:hypothetical protein
MNKNSLLNYIGWILAAVIFVLLILAGDKLRNLLDPEFAMVAEPAADCDLRQETCKTSLADDKHVLFSISPKTIPLLKPLTLTTELQGIEARKVEVDIVGLNMEMGYNRPVLLAVSENTFSGAATLPVCTLDRMEWEARVMIYTKNDQVYLVPFRFYTSRDQAAQ